MAEDREEGKTFCDGYLTVYLALTMAVILSLCLALIEGARSNAIRMETECVMEIALDSILAEYHRELFRQYNLFAIDSSYGTAAAGHEKVKQHLHRYLSRNFSQEDIFLSDILYRDLLGISVETIEMTGVSLLTDGKGAVFRERAAEAVRDDCNLNLLEQLTYWMQTVESNGLLEEDIAERKQEVDRQIEAFNGQEIQISESEWITVQVENPTKKLEEIRKQGILKYVLEEDGLSMKQLNPEQLISARMERGEISCGNRPLLQQSEAEKLWERFCFQEYLIRYMGHYGLEKENGALSYQLEYLLSGKTGDMENLKSVANRLCAIREVANAIYLFSDQEKCKAAELLATAITALIQIPQLMELLKIALLLGWAYAESIYDVKLLLEGKSVPLLKDDASWHYGIENALLLGMDSEDSASKGLSYVDYLRILMMFTEQDTLTARAMNMVEADIRLMPYNSAFRLDACCDWVQFCVGVSSKYGYQYEITREKQYQ